MELSIINIGNSKGIRLSKTILEKYSFNDKVELILAEDHIVLKPKSEPRKGWDKAFKKMLERGDDRLFIDSASFQERMDSH